MRVACVVLSVVLLSGCGRLPLPKLQTHPRPYDTSIPKEELHDIAEAVLRYQFRSVADSNLSKGPGYFISFVERTPDRGDLNSTDPPPEFINRFAGHTPPVRKGSEITMGGGTRFHISGVTRISKESVEVIAGVRGVGGWTYLLGKRNGEWTVATLISLRD